MNSGVCVRELCDRFVIEGETPPEFTVRAWELKKRLMIAREDASITLRVLDGANKMILEYFSEKVPHILSDYSVNLEDVAAPEDLPGDYEDDGCLLELLSSDFQKTVHDAMELADSVEIACEKSGVTLRAKGSEVAGSNHFKDSADLGDKPLKKGEKPNHIRITTATRKKYILF